MKLRTLIGSRHEFSNFECRLVKLMVSRQEFRLISQKLVTRNKESRRLADFFV